MAELLELLVYFLLDLFGNVSIELILEWLFNRLPAAIRRALSLENHPIVQAIVWCFVGMGVGGLSLLIYGQPFFPRGRFPGLSLLLSPLVTGAVMEFVGRRRAARGKPPLPLSNFRNGAAFALGFALIRFFFAAAN
jgi:hypothetical protein